MTKGRGLWLFVALGLAAVILVVVAIVNLSSLGGVRVVAAWPTDGAADVPITAPMRLTFSAQMDAASVEAHLRVEPEIEVRLVGEGREIAIRPRPAWSPGNAYTVTLEGGTLTQSGRQLGDDQVWRFSTRVPQVLYLGRPSGDEEVRQIFAASPGGTGSRQLTSQPLGVWDYAVHPQGEAVVYSVLREDGGSDLWYMDRQGSDQRVLLACPQAACLNPAWSPDGRELAYERRDVWADAPNLDPKAGRIWLLDLERNRERPLFDYDVALHSPVWAPEGGRLAYVSPVLPGVEVYDLASGDLQQFGNEWGDAPVWSPEGKQLVVPELILAGESLVVRLVLLDLESEQGMDISGPDDLVKDVSPAWSPGGGWIAAGRQFLDEERWTPGRQIWLLRPDGSEAYPLLEEPMADHLGLSWRPDGGALAYARSDLTEGPQPVPDVSVWIFDLLERRSVQVAEQGVLPRWLP